MPVVVVCLMPLVERERGRERKSLYAPHVVHPFVLRPFAFVSYGHAAFMDVERLTDGLTEVGPGQESICIEHCPP